MSKAKAAQIHFPNGIGSPAHRALLVAGIERLEELTRYSESEIKALHGVGPKALRILRAALEERGLAFAQASTAKKKPPESDFPRGIGAPAHSALLVAGIQGLNQLARYSEKEIKNLHGVGPKAIRILKEALETRGLSFAVKK